MRVVPTRCVPISGRQQKQSPAVATTRFISQLMRKCSGWRTTITSPLAAGGAWLQT